MSARAEVGAGDDGHYFVVRGRRWRASDPNIPDALRAELVAELMSARREVRNDPGTARPRVHDAKVALGERGEPWWEPTDAGQRERLRAAIRTLLRHRSPEASICPSDVARVVGGTRWRGLMSTAREVVSELADHEVVRVQQRGQPVDPRTATGPLRVARGPQW